MIKKVFVIGLCVLVSGCLSQQSREVTAPAPRQSGDPGFDGQRPNPGFRNFSGDGPLQNRSGDGMQRMGNWSRDGVGPRGGMGLPPQMGLPQESFDACDGKSSGEECQFTVNERAVSGSCQGDAGNLSCRPVFQDQINRGART
ncbi:MAG: hypothetical protein ABH834_00240 [Candidatus Altiarchaeota archaeon]